MRVKQSVIYLKLYFLKIKLKILLHILCCYKLLFHVTFLPSFLDSIESLRCSWQIFARNKVDVDKGFLRPVLVGVSRSCAPGRGTKTRTIAGARAGSRRETKKKKKSNRGLAWWIDDASKINVNTTKLVPAVFARGYGISVFTNSIDNNSSFAALFFFSLVRPAIRSPSWETRPPEIIGFRGLNYFLLHLASETFALGKERRHDRNGTDWGSLCSPPPPTVTRT